MPPEELPPEELLLDELPPEELLDELLVPEELPPLEELVPEELLDDVPLEELPPLEELLPEELVPEELLPLEELVPDELLDDVPLEELPPLEELLPEELVPEKSCSHWKNWYQTNCSTSYSCPEELPPLEELVPDELLEDVPLEEVEEPLLDEVPPEEPLPEELPLDEVPGGTSSAALMGEDVVETDPQATSVSSIEQTAERTNVVADTAEPPSHKFAVGPCNAPNPRRQHVSVGRLCPCHQSATRRGPLDIESRANPFGARTTKGCSAITCNIIGALWCARSHPWTALAPLACTDSAA